MYLYLCLNNVFKIKTRAHLLSVTEHKGALLLNVGNAALFLQAMLFPCCVKTHPFLSPGNKASPETKCFTVGVYQPDRAECLAC